MNKARVRAPEIPRSLQWFNTEESLWLADLRGKVVLLDFWTYGCINCQHIQPDLRYLEQKYPDGLVVIGVHSPKFPNEKIPAQLQKAINRQFIQHPVVHDPELQMTSLYAVKAWPSVVLIDPEAYIVGVSRGEGKRRQLDELIAGYLAERPKDAASTPLPAPNLNTEPTSTLSFPGKLLATDGRLFISDSGRNRILECDLNGRIRRSFGSGSAGLVDGDGEYSSFNNPQGLVKVEDNLYVADAGNHAIRRINLTTGEVETIAGTGTQNRKMPERYETAVGTALNSPWDIAYHNNVLYVAMAGQHQIWQLPFTAPGFSVYAGNGQELLQDGPARTASFAQPSGLALFDVHLFVADAESSAIRVIRMPTQTVATLVGQGLFDFGDQEGLGRAAQLQHPMDLTMDSKRGQLWIADTYNSKIKTLSLTNNRVTDFNIYHPLNEPGGLSILGDDLYIANTNAHEILRVNIPNREVQVLDIGQPESE